MAAPVPEVDVAQAIATVMGWTYTTQIKTGEPRSPTEPGCADVVCWVWAYGETTQPFLNAPAAGSYYRTRIQARVLGQADAREAGLALARRIRDIVHCNAPTGYVSALLVPGLGGPNYLGVNEAGQPMWSLNWEIAYTWLGGS